MLLQNAAAELSDLLTHSPDAKPEHVCVFSKSVFRLLTSLAKNSKLEAFSLLLGSVCQPAANGSRGDLVSSYVKYAQVFCISPGDPFAAGWHTEAKSKEKTQGLECFAGDVRSRDATLETFKKCLGFYSPCGM